MKCGWLPTEPRDPFYAGRQHRSPPSKDPRTAPQATDSTESRGVDSNTSVKFPEHVTRGRKLARNRLNNT